MDTVIPDIERLQAGEEYLRALNKLGFDPEGLFWGFDVSEDKFVLVLVSSFFDVAGPLELSTLLFKAYNASATPKEIDPFILRLHSPAHALVKILKGQLGMAPLRVIDKETGKGRPNRRGELHIDMQIGDLKIPLQYVYKLVDKSQPNVDLARRWAFITSKVDKLAA